MRVDLRLQGIQLTLSLLLLFHYNIIHKLTDLRNRRAKCFSQMFYFHGTAYINIRIHISGFPLLHRIIQTAQWLGNPGRYHLIQDYHRKHCQSYQKDYQISHTCHAHTERFHGNHTDQLPSRVTDCFYCNQTLFSMKILFYSSIFISCCLGIVFLIQPHVDQVLLGMIDNFPVRRHQIYIFTGSVCVCLLKKLLDTAVIHINQKNTQHGIPISGKLHCTA